MNHYFAIFFIFLLTPLGFSSAFGEVVDFTTNKSLYHEGDQLSISGNVFYDSDFPTVTIQIFNPNKSNFAGVDVVTVNPDGSFSVDFRVGGIQWSTDGTYTIKITYDGNMEKSIEYEELLSTQSISEPTPEPTPNSESTIFEKLTSNFITLKFKIPNFPSLDKTPQYYIDRYNNEINYKSWIDSQFQGVSIYNILGYHDPILVPDWIRNNAEWWAAGTISDSTFISGIDFMLENNIIMISNIPSSGNISEDEIPDWIRNNAHWWSQNLISEDEFVNSLKFLIQNGIIVIN